jgi:hypothetical protein
MAITTKKVRVPLTAKEVEVKGDELARIELQRLQLDDERRRVSGDYRKRLKDLDADIRVLAMDRDTRTEEREFEAERRPNLKLLQYEYHRLDGGGIIPAATRKMTKEEAKAEQQLTLDDAQDAKAKAKSKGNGEAPPDGKGKSSPVKLVHTTANKRPKGSAKAQPPGAHPS